jgi:hypothetical protein
LEKEPRFPLYTGLVARGVTLEAVEIRIPDPYAFAVQPLLYRRSYLGIHSHKSIRDLFAEEPRMLA